MNLGTERHKKQYFDAIDKFKIPGEHCCVACFAVCIGPCQIKLLHSKSVCAVCVLICQATATGCFCMTELGHGSNVAALQTECILDTTTDEWVVNTPDDSAIKWYVSHNEPTHTGLFMSPQLCKHAVGITSQYRLLAYIDALCLQHMMLVMVDLC